MTLKRATLRRDRALKRVDRCEVDRRNRRRGQPLHIAAHHVGFVFNRHAVGCFIHATPVIDAQVLHVCDQRICSLRRCGPCTVASAQRAALPRKNARREGLCISSMSQTLFRVSLKRRQLRRCCLFTVTVPSLAIWLSTTSQICGPSVPSFTEAQPATHMRVQDQSVRPCSKASCWRCAALGLWTHRCV